MQEGSSSQPVGHNISDISLVMIPNSSKITVTKPQIILWLGGRSIREVENHWPEGTATNSTETQAGMDGGWPLEVMMQTFERTLLSV